MYDMESVQTIFIFTLTEVRSVSVNGIVGTNFVSYAFLFIMFDDLFISSPIIPTFK